MESDLDYRKRIFAKAYSCGLPSAQWVAKAATAAGADLDAIGAGYEMMRLQPPNIDRQAVHIHDVNPVGVVNADGSVSAVFRAVVTRSAPPDPFGDAVRAAQDRPAEPEPPYRPDEFTEPGFDADEAYRRAMGGGA